jgi:UDP:flavonoid glycosyltransferase YjiC (YdhE family)
MLSKRMSCTHSVIRRCEVRVLFTFAGGSGHVEPLVPIARAVRDAGHPVAFSGRSAVAERVRELGFEMFVTGPPGPEAPSTRTPLLEVDLEREARVLRDGFAGRIARERAAGVLKICGAWRPDLLICGEVDFGAMVAAERAGLPFATVLISATDTFVRNEVVAEPLDALRAEHGLAPESPRESLVLSPFPHRLRRLPPNALAFRTAPVQRPTTDATAIYLTLGTIFNLESGDLFERVLEGLRELQVDVVATVGRNLDPDELGPQPANVRLERYLPQADVLPHCRAVISHGGSGSILGALAHGLPSVLLPMGADQPRNAARCQELGVARALDAVRATPETVREAVANVLADPSYRSAAERIADEIAALPGPDHAGRLIERLAR